LGHDWRGASERAAHVQRINARHSRVQWMHNGGQASSRLCWRIRVRRACSARPRPPAALLRHGVSKWSWELL